MNTDTAAPAAPLAMPTMDAIAFAHEMSGHGFYVRLDNVGNGMSTVTAMSDADMAALLADIAENEA
jgi:hypothetical protein